MSKPYTYATTLSFGTDGEPGYSEIDVEVSFTVAWGSPESGRHGPPEHYDPGSGDAVEGITLLTVEGKPRPWDMGFGFLSDDAFAEMVAEKLEGSDAHLESMIAEASEVEEAHQEDPDDARDRAFDDRLNGFDQ